MHHWITFKNDLPSRDAARIRKVATTLQGGGFVSRAPPPTTRFSLHDKQPAQVQVHHHQQAVLRAGSRQVTRYFYKTNARGQRLSSKVYTLQHGGPVQVAREVAKAALHGSSSSSSSRRHLPSSVRAAVRHAVASGSVTEAQGRKYCDKFAQDAGKGKVLIHIRERGKHKVRQYEAMCLMKKHPGKHDIRDMKTKHVSVAYVQTFAC